MRVPHSEIQAKLELEKLARRKKRKAKPSASGVSREQGYRLGEADFLGLLLLLPASGTVFAPAAMESR
jgi:hypothetical protein